MKILLYGTKNNDEEVSSKVSYEKRKMQANELKIFNIGINKFKIFEIKKMLVIIKNKSA